jgi:hypothetical protein
MGIRPCENNEQPSSVQIEVPQRSTLRDRFLTSINGLIRTNKSNRYEISNKQVKSNCFRSFLRFIFCQFASPHSRRSTSLEIANQSGKKLSTKLSVISQVTIDREAAGIKNLSFRSMKILPIGKKFVEH